MLLLLLSLIVSDPIYKAEGSHLEITGTGTITWDDIKTKSQYTKMVTCNVNEGITIIGDQAFRGCSLLESISFPESLIEISNRCFWGTALKNLTIPKNLNTFLTVNTLYSVNFEAFYVHSSNTYYKVYDSCLYTYDGSVLVSVPTMKTSISFLNDVQEIGQYCFWKSRIPSISVPDSVMKLNSQSFVDAGTNKEILFGQESLLTSICSNAFYALAITHFEVPPKVVSISAQAFVMCKIVNFSFIPVSNLQSLNGACFDRCTELLKVELPKSIEVIDLLAFTGCTKLKSITIEDGCENYAATSDGILFSAGFDEVIFIPPDANSLSIPKNTSGFAAGILQKLTNIDIESVSLSDENEYLEYRGGIFYSKYFSSAISAIGSIVDAVIHFNSTSLEVSVFENVVSLETLTFEENSKCTKIMKYACKGCSGLSNLEIPPQVTILDLMAFYGSGLISISIPAKTTTISESCFEATKNLKTVIFADGSLLSSIGRLAFGSSTVCNIQLPSNLKSFGTRSFYKSSIQSIKIPNGITSIVFEMFLESSITECLFDEESKLTKFESSSIMNCKSLTKVQISPLVTTLESTCFSGCSSLVDVEFIGVSTIKTIPSLVFDGCSSLKTIQLPSSIEKVDASSFYGCFSLTVLEITSESLFEFVEGCLYREEKSVLVLFVPGLKTCSVLPTVKEIGSNAFFGDSFLETIDFGDKSSLGQIGAETFYGCSKLTVLKLPSSIVSIADGCFKGCSNLEEWTVGDQSRLTNIGDSLFDGCTSLRIASFGANSALTSIGVSAFAGCISLQSISIPGNVTSIGSSAFSGCTKLSDVIFEHTNHSQRFVIPSECFSECTSLPSIVIPESVTSIDFNAFRGCTNLWYVIIHEGTSSLGDGAFSNCGLSGIFLPSSVVSVGSQCFFSNQYMTNFTSAAKELSLGSNCFSLCSSLRFVGLCAENSIDGQYIFNGCPVSVVYVTKIYPTESVSGVNVAKIMDRCLIFPTNLFTGITKNFHSSLIHASTLLNSDDD